MSVTGWSAVPIVLVLLLAPTDNPTTPPVDIYAVAEGSSGNHVALSSSEQAVLGSGGSLGSGAVVEPGLVGGGGPVCGVTGRLVAGSKGDRAEFRLCLPSEPVAPVVSGGVPVVVSVSDVSRLLVEGSGLVRQPPGDMVIVSKDLIVYTDPSSRTLSTTVGGVPVEVVVTPVSYTWDWGDGASTTTTDPGAPYPYQTVVHRYRQRLKGVVVSLTTSWSATFSVEGGPPQPVSGTVTTTESSAPFDLVRLVGVLTDDAEEAQGH